MREKGSILPLVLALVALGVMIFGTISYFLLKEKLIGPQISPGSESPSTKASNIPEKKPPIVDHFACGDYCPGPPEKYMVKIYEGVEDPQECRLIGGIPYTYYGWGETHICKAE